MPVQTDALRHTAIRPRWDVVFELGCARRARPVMNSRGARRVAMSLDPLVTNLGPVDDEELGHGIKHGLGEAARVLGPPECDLLEVLVLKAGGDGVQARPLTICANNSTRTQHTRAHTNTFSLKHTRTQHTHTDGLLRPGRREALIDHRAEAGDRGHVDNAWEQI